MNTLLKKFKYLTFHLESMKSLTPEDFQKLIWEIQAVLPPDYGIQLPWPEPKDECKPLLTERGIQLVEKTSMTNIEGDVVERNVLCEWKSALYTERIMTLDNKTLNRIHSELKKALKRAEKKEFTSEEYISNWNSRAYELL